MRHIAKRLVIKPHIRTLPISWDRHLHPVLPSSMRRVRHGATICRCPISRRAMPRRRVYDYLTLSHDPFRLRCRPRQPLIRSPMLPCNCAQTLFFFLRLGNPFCHLTNDWSPRVPRVPQMPTANALAFYHKRTATGGHLHCLRFDFLASLYTPCIINTANLHSTHVVQVYKKGGNEGHTAAPCIVSPDYYYYSAMFYSGRQ
ncbi:hypothetical protein K504DRAFT_188129 [Pleomassaria siparia CBS 279.74]|uniref:Uncharacterized protein n=1 Tax=Pleomassaria siparia CBS 279.74 TaxID=1314801 RepID=A0A6G1JQJ5_9PLEO|nr:hypothetical protein K504DRAFT_188129 [Pleomassaria siparia CBS 279.74]